MPKLARTLVAGAVLVAAFSTTAGAGVGFGADVVSRYVWRGTDFGNAVSVQPALAYSAGAVEIGAWSSWAVDRGGANENDLYVSYDAGPVGVTLTDYFFPTAAPADFFSYGDDDAVHVLEVSASADLGPASLLAAFNFSGDPEDSYWLEATLPVEVLSDDDVEVGLTVGVGNGVYTTDTDTDLVSIALEVSRDGYFGSYILNPEAEITFLVFGISF